MIDKTKIKGALKWQVLNISLQSILQFAFIMISARVLPKDVHGAFAILYALVFIMSIASEGGVSSAIVQRKEINKSHISIAFYITLLLSIIAFIGLALFADTIVAFYEGKIKQDEIYQASLIFLMMALGKVSEAILIKNFRFKHIFIAKNSGFFIGNIVVMLILARLNFGIYALIWGYITTQFLITVIYYFYCRHTFKIEFKTQEFKDLFYFGSSFTLLNTINYFTSQVDKFLIGKYFSVVELSIYEKGQFVSKIPPKYIGSSIDSVMFSTFSKLEDSKVKRGYFRNIIFWVMLLSSYGTIVFYFNSSLIINIILGENWGEVVPFLEILSLTIPAILLARLGDILVRSENKIFNSIIVKLLFLISLVLSIYFLRNTTTFTITLATALCYWLHGLLMLLLSGMIIKSSILQLFYKFILPLCLTIPIILKYYFVTTFELSDLYSLIVNVISDFLIIIILLYIFRNTSIVKKIINQLGNNKLTLLIRRR